MPSKHVPTPARPVKPDGIRFAPTMFDVIALRTITAAVKDASGNPFLSTDRAIRFALGLAVRVIAAGRQAEFSAIPASSLLSDLADHPAT